MEGRRHHERQIDSEKSAVAVGTRQNIARRQPAAHRIDDGVEVNRHRKGEYERGAALVEIENRIHRRLQSLFEVARFKPSIENVGDRCLGQNSVQLMWLWQECQPASPETAVSRASCPRSRTSLTR